MNCTGIRCRGLQDMAFDHKEIIEECYRWLQKRIIEHPLGFNLLPDKFSLRELQNLYEAILNVKLGPAQLPQEILCYGPAD